ncbi:SPW repeat domain-containing protein [Streptomyces coeruleorubidus]|uniref:SPW repeat domain-containing protein n=1 Tax=Streptomyces coeruleorubidus TaxID=116188 RepID=UPI0033DEB215
MTVQDHSAAPATRPPLARRWRNGWLRTSVISAVMLASGLWLFLGGWLIGYPFNEPTVDARLHEMIVGVIVFLTALARLIRPRGVSSDLLIAVAGGWLIAAPFALSYGGTAKADAARVNDIATGGLLVVLAVVSLALWLRSSASRSR